ncbi:MAG: Maf family protein [Solirubrobacteraceae bacterium]
MLASGSPQRQAILSRLGVQFSVRVSGADELERGDPAEVTLENALRKARAVARRPSEEAVIACDTVVALDGQIYGKPADAVQAGATLRALAGRTHEVTSGLVVALPGEERTATARTTVRFRELDGATLDWYLATEEWRERAGGYAIQGAGAALVDAIEGDYENIVGLPVASLLGLYPQLLRR